jgi:hypothetical protein
MGREISLFTDYHQQENRVTNYCGLILKMIYKESPTAFETIIVNLIGEEDVDISVNPRFEQQGKQKDSVPDLYIYQPSFAIFFETKLTDWFYSDQIKRHISAIASESTDKKILFLLSCDENLKNLDKYQKDAKADRISLVPITFERLLAEVEQVKINETLESIIEEFRGYLDHNNLLPRWKYLLDVVNCGNTIHEVEKGFYACPNTGRAYSHRRAKYFGAYENKNVSMLCEIDAVVVKEGEEFSVKWNNQTTQKDSEIIRRAKEITDNWDEWRIKESEKTPMQIFLLGKKVKLKSGFKKDSAGGLFGSKKYFWDIAQDVGDVYGLAKKLNGRAWSLPEDDCWENK